MGRLITWLCILEPKRGHFGKKKLMANLEVEVKITRRGG